MNSKCKKLRTGNGKIQVISAKLYHHIRERERENCDGKGKAKKFGVQHVKQQQCEIQI